MPLISVIMAVYNGASTLPRTLESLSNQTCQDFEVVIVNDESTDHSEQVIHDFIKKHPQVVVQYIHQANKGLGGARNTAMRAASGRFLCLLDQDDIWYPKKLERTVSVFESRPEVFFVTHRLYRRVQGEIKEIVYCDSVNGNLFQKLLFNTNFFCGSAMSFRKEVLDKIGYFSEDRGGIHLVEDYDYWLRAAAAGLNFFLVEEVLGEYVVHSQNFSKNRMLMLHNEWSVVWKHYRQRPKGKWFDILKLMKRRGKIFVNQAFALSAK